MMGTEDKTLFCFCHWGWKNKVLLDGSTSYVGGITRQVVVKTGIKYNDFVNAVFDRLCVDPSDKILHFTVKFDRSQLIELRDQEDVDVLLQFNDSFAHVYASSLEEEPNSVPPSGGAKEIELIVESDSKPDTTPAGDDENDLESPLKKKARLQSAVDDKPQQKEAVADDGQKHAGVTRSSSSYMETLNQDAVGLPEGELQNNTQNGFNAQFSNLNHHKYTQSASSAMQDTFWTQCPSCKIRYQYYIKYVNNNLRCQRCSKIFTAYDLSSQGAPCGPKWSQPGGQHVPLKSNLNQSSEQNGLPNQGTSKMTAGSAGFPPSQTGYQPGFSSKPAGFEPEKCRGKTAPVFEDIRTKQKDEKLKRGYERTRLTEVGRLFVKPNELYKFSHIIPSFKMTGTEREGVPVGSFELDPTSLPLNPDDIWYPEKVIGDSRAANSEPVENVSPAVCTGTRDKSRISGNATISLKSVELKGIHAANVTNGESAKVRRSPKGVNISEEKQSKMSSHSANDTSSTDFDDNCVKRDRHSSPRIPSQLSCPADEELHSCTQSFDLSNSSGSSKNPITLSDDKSSEEVFCDFRMDISMGKFQVDQVWALYRPNSMPRTYAQIRKIVPAPFKLHVVLLEACAGPKKAQLVCGMFKVNEKRQVYDPISFSHMVKAVSINRNRFEIYPREGDIWALYKNWKKLSLHPDTSEYEIVEVIGNSKDRIRVASMVRVNGFKSVFGSPRIQRSKPAVLEIHKDKFGRFSHQIPAFQLTGEKGGVLRGCWELNPASVPCSQ